MHAPLRPAIRLPCPGEVGVNLVSHRHWWLIHSPLQSIEGARLLPGPFHFSARFDFRDGYAGLGYSAWYDYESLECEKDSMTTKRDLTESDALMLIMLMALSIILCRDIRVIMHTKWLMTNRSFCYRIVAALTGCCIDPVSIKGNQP